MRARNCWLIIETITAYALPAYLWMWGIISLPLWLWGATDADPTSRWYLISLAGGALGAIGMIGLLTAVIRNEPITRVNFAKLCVLTGCGLFGIWATITSHFTGFSIDPFSVVAAIVPTLCTLHLWVLCVRLIGANTHPATHC